MDNRKITAEYRMSQWAQVISDRKSSGVTIKSYCQNIGISRDAYYYWQKKLRKAAYEQMALIPVESAQANLTKTSFTEVKLNDSFTQTFPIESNLHNNIQIQISKVRISADSEYPVEKLAYLLRELERQC